MDRLTKEIRQLRRYGFLQCAVLIVCATIIKGGKVLLVRHSSEWKPDYGDWLLPAGSVETGESLEKALRREVKEELGLKVEIVKRLVEHVDPYTGDILVNFLCKLSMIEIAISSELKEAKWFNINEIKKLGEIDPNLKQFLIKTLRTGTAD